MKVNRVFENKNGKDILLDAKIEYEEVCGFIRDFINFENLVSGTIKNVTRYYYERNVEKFGDSILIVVFGDYEKKDLDIPAILIDNETEKDLHKFIEDPELYKSTKNYNL